MVRRCLVAALVCGLFAGLVWAGEIRGKVKSTDPDKNSITITTEDKGTDQTLAVSPDAKIIRLEGRKLKTAVPKDVPGGLGGLKVGDGVVITTETKDGKEQASTIRVEGLTVLKKKKKK